MASHEAPNKESTQKESPAARRQRSSRSQPRPNSSGAGLRRREKNGSREDHRQRPSSGESDAKKRRRKRSDRGESSKDKRRRSSRDGKSKPRRRSSNGSAKDRIGETLGSYRLNGVLGQGGMGTVYKAEHVMLGRDVALKLLLDEYTKSREAVARFFREARAVNKIRHKNIVDVTDLVELDDGSSFIIMELLHGRPLSRVIRKERLTVGRSLRMMLQICDGLAAAHAVDIVHRDLKPDNIFICRAPDGGDLVKLLDFGVAKLLSDDPDEIQQHRTAVGAVVGTPAFMSPEQAGCLRVDARSDIYSLGAILYDIFVGRPPFKANSFGEYVRKHLDERPTPPSEVVGATPLSADLENLILRCLEKKPGLRYQSATELREALQGLLSDNRAPSVPSPANKSGANTPRQSSTPSVASHPRADSSLAYRVGHDSSANKSSPFFLDSAARTPPKSRLWSIMFVTLILATASGAGLYWVFRSTLSASEEKGAVYIPPKDAESSEPGAPPPAAEPDPNGQ